MSAQILPFPAAPERGRGLTVETYPFGGCPHCGRHDEDEDTWRQNRFKLAEYMTVNLIDV